MYPKNKTIIKGQCSKPKFCIMFWANFNSTEKREREREREREEEDFQSSIFWSISYLQFKKKKGR